MVPKNPNRLLRRRFKFASRLVNSVNVNLMDSNLSNLLSACLMEDLHSVRFTQSAFSCTLQKSIVNLAYFLTTSKLLSTCDKSTYVRIFQTLFDNLASPMYSYYKPGDSGMVSSLKSRVFPPAMNRHVIQIAGHICKSCKEWL